MMLVVAVALTLVLSTVSGQEISSECPGDGFFADAVQCDKYYSCSGGVLTEKLCPDGFVFNDVNPALEKCDFPFQVSCEGRPERQPPQPTENCPRQYGYFPDSDPSICNRFYYCANGLGSELTCPITLVFSLLSGTCVFPAQAKRPNCEAEILFNFTCPKVPDNIAVGHPRFADPDDCQYFYVCINGIDPRHNGCSFGQVYNGLTEACGSPQEVPECKDYYFEYFQKYFATLKAEGRHPEPDILQAAINSGYDVPAVPKHVQITRQSIPAATRKRQELAETSVIQQPQTRVAAAGSRTRVPADVPQSRVVDATIPQAQAVPAANPPRRRRPGLRRRPALANRRRPANKPTTSTTTTTTTTTTTPAPEYYYDLDYYYDDATGNLAPVGAQSAA